MNTCQNCQTIFFLNLFFSTYLSIPFSFSGKTHSRFIKIVLILSSNDSTTPPTLVVLEMWSKMAWIGQDVALTWLKLDQNGAWMNIIENINVGGKFRFCFERKKIETETKPLAFSATVQETRTKNRITFTLLFQIFSILITTIDGCCAWVLAEWQADSKGQ